MLLGRLKIRWENWYVWESCQSNSFSNVCLSSRFIVGNFFFGLKQQQNSNNNMNVYEVYKLEIYHFFLTVYFCGAPKLSMHPPC